MPGTGLEPVWPCGLGILSPLRLPVSPPGLLADPSLDLLRARFGNLEQPDRSLRRRVPIFLPVLQRAQRYAEPLRELRLAEAGRCANSLDPIALHVSRRRKVGGESRNRTGVHGFAGRCMTTLPSRLATKKGSHADFP